METIFGKYIFVCVCVIVDIGKPNPNLNQKQYLSNEASICKQIGILAS